MECDDTLIAEVSKVIELGVPPLVAAMAQGATEEEFADWIKRGRRAGQGDEPYVKFVEAIRVAEARCEGILIGKVRTAAQSNWNAAAWLAERRFPQRYVRRSVNDDKDHADSGEPQDDDPFEALDNVTELHRR